MKLVLLVIAAFLAQASDETVSDSRHSVVMYQALKKAGVPAELHVYATGRHGFGVRKSTHPCSTWTEPCLGWRQGLGMLTTAA